MVVNFGGFYLLFTKCPRSNIICLYPSSLAKDFWFLRSVADQKLLASEDGLYQSKKFQKKKSFKLNTLGFPIRVGGLE